MCGQGKPCKDCSMGPCGPGGDYMRGGVSYTNCDKCGGAKLYGKKCKCETEEKKEDGKKNRS